MSARQTSLPEAPTSSRAHRAALRPPVTRAESVVRTALVNRLRASGAPLVTVTAPAGYGKTTLLAQWEARDERPFAWVRLDDDTDPRVLVRNLAVALDQRPIVLVLDDAHLLRSRGSLPVFAALAEQVPDGSTLVLAGRSVRLAGARKSCSSAMPESRSPRTSGWRSGSAWKAGPRGRTWPRWRSASAATTESDPRERRRCASSSTSTIGR